VELDDSFSLVGDDAFELSDPEAGFGEALSCTCKILVSFFELLGEVVHQDDQLFRIHILEIGLCHKGLFPRKADYCDQK